MISLRFKERWNLLVAKTKGSIVQECPPELLACEVCGQLKCDSKRWLQCERRLAALRYAVSPLGGKANTPEAVPGVQDLR